MNEDVIIDLKQFIATTVSQQTVELGERIDKVEQRLGGVEGRLDGVENRLDKVENKMDDLIVFVTDAIDTSNEIQGKQLKSHERRITKLERAHSA